MTDSPDIAPPDHRLREQSVDLLRQCLEQAERGEVTEVLVLMQHEEDDFTVRWTQSLSAVKRIGILEVAKQLAVRERLDD